MFEKLIQEDSLNKGRIKINKLIDGLGQYTGKTSIIKANPSNLWDGSYHNFFLELTSGDTFANSLNAGGTRTAVVPVKPSAKYYINITGSHDRFRVADAPELFNFDQNSYSLKGQMTKHAFDNSLSSYELTTSANAKYLYIQVSASGHEPVLMVTDDESEQFSRAYTIDISSHEYFQLTEALNLTKHKKPNLFIVANQGQTAYVGTGSGYYSLVLEVKPNTTYYIKKLSESNRFRAAGFANMPELLDNVTELYFGDNESRNNEIVKITVGDRIQFLMLYLSTMGESPDVSVTTNKKYAGKAEYVIKDEYLPTLSTRDEGNIKKSVIIGEFNKLFETREYTGKALTELEAMQASEVYALYDDLVTKYPDMASSKTLATDDSGNPIKEYTFTPAIGNLTAYNPETILITSGIHGSEKASVLGVAEFFQQLMNDWKIHENLSSLKSNFIFKVIPIAVPEAFNLNTRRKANGVNINRNFEKYWNEISDTDKGAAPYSEVETRTIRDWWIDNLDALTYIDCHTFISQAVPQTRWTFMDSDSENPYNPVYAAQVRRLSQAWPLRYYNKEDSIYMGSHIHDVSAMSFREAEEQGIKNPCMLETVDPVENYGKYDRRTIELMSDLLGNYLLGIASYES